MKLRLERIAKEYHDNLNGLGFIRNNLIERVYQQGSSYLILGRSDQLWSYIFSRDSQELEALIVDYQDESKYFAAVEDWMIPIILKDRETEWRLETNRYLLSDNKRIKENKNKIISLGVTDAEYIFANSNYQQFTSIEYIKDRLKEGVSAGIEMDGKLVAWGLTHDDGALGFLHVLAEYRRLGYGRDITISLIKQKRRLNQRVFLNIEDTNQKSVNLVELLGFTLDRRITWLKLK